MSISYLSGIVASRLEQHPFQFSIFHRSLFCYRITKMRIFLLFCKYPCDFSYFLMLRPPQRVDDLSVRRVEQRPFLLDIDVGHSQLPDMAEALVDSRLLHPRAPGEARPGLASGVKGEAGQPLGLRPAAQVLVDPPCRLVFVCGLAVQGAQPPAPATNEPRQIRRRLLGNFHSHLRFVVAPRSGFPPVVSPDLPHSRLGVPEIRKVRAHEQEREHEHIEGGADPEILSCRIDYPLHRLRTEVLVVNCFQISNFDIPETVEKGLLLLRPKL